MAIKSGQPPWLSVAAILGVVLAIPAAEHFTKSKVTTVQPLVLTASPRAAQLPPHLGVQADYAARRSLSSSGSAGTDVPAPD